MEKFEFSFNEKSYALSETNCMAYINDEEKPLEGLEFEEILSLLAKGTPEFDIEYFNTSCESCNFGTEEKLKAFPFLEYHFYAFGLDGKYVLSSLSEGYEPLTYDKMVSVEKLDSMYLVSIIVCKACGDFTVEMELVEL